MPRYNGNLCMGPEYGFAFTLEKNGWFKDADIAVVKASRDGGDNSHWRKTARLTGRWCKPSRMPVRVWTGPSIPKWSLPGFCICRGKQCRNFHSGERFPLSGASGQSGGRFETVRGYVRTGCAKAVVGENANWAGKNESDPETGNLTGGLDGRDTEVQGKTTRQVMKDLAESRPSLGYAPTRDLPQADFRGSDGSALQRPVSDQHRSPFCL